MNIEEIEGYGIVSSASKNDAEGAVNMALIFFESKDQIGLNNLGIKTTEFNICFESFQNSIPINTDSFVKINRFYKEINIWFIEE